MEIKYLGHSSFLIKTKDIKIVTDPFDTSIGLKFPKVEADVVTVSHNHFDHNNASAVKGILDGTNPLVLNMPGEFEKKGVRIFGYRGYHDKSKGSERGEVVLYKIESEEMTILHCGDLGNVPEDVFVDTIGDVDILMVPVGGHYTLDPDEAVAVIKKVEPSIILPMHYNQPKLDQSKFKELSPVAEFLKKFGAESLASVPKLIIRKDELEQEMKVVLLDLYI